MFPRVIHKGYIYLIVRRFANGNTHFVDTVLYSREYYHIEESRMKADVVPYKLYPGTKARFKKWRECNDLTADQALNALLDCEHEKARRRRRGSRSVSR